MPQRLLPIFPDAVTPIKALLSVGKQEERVVHLHGVCWCSVMPRQADLCGLGQTLTAPPLSISRVTASATRMPSTPAERIPPA